MRAVFAVGEERRSVRPVTARWEENRDLRRIIKPSCEIVEDQRAEIRITKLLEPPLAKGAFGKVLLARNARINGRQSRCFPREVGQSHPTGGIRGVKKIQTGCRKEMPVVERECVREQMARALYYVMELGDSQNRAGRICRNYTRPRTSEHAPENRRRRISPAECCGFALSLAEERHRNFLHASN